jgi:hypothetical protein
MATSQREILDLCGCRGESWAPWHVVAKCQEGRPLVTRDEQALFEACTGRTRPLTEPDEIWIDKGRRCGGSRYGGAAAVQAVVQPHANLAPGEAAVVALAAADKEQARVLLGYSVSVFRDREELGGMVAPTSGWAALRQLVTRETRWGMDFRNHATIEVRRSHFGSIRGRTFKRAIADEVAFWASEDGSNPASEVLAAIRPGLATLRGQLLVITTPFLKSGPVWDTYLRYYGKDDPRVLIWKAPTRVMNPLIPESLVQDALERDPESAKSEWLGEFRDDAGSLVTDAALRACVVPGRGLLEPHADHRYLIFVDPATGSGSDSMTMAIAHVEHRHGRPVAVVDGVAEARVPFDPADVVVAIAGHARAYRVDRVHGDRFAYGWTSALFERAGLRYEVSPMSKSEVYLSALALINARMIELPDEARLLAQIAGLQRRPGASGRESVDHAAKAGAHDDVANAALGAAALGAAARRDRGAGSVVVRGGDTHGVLELAARGGGSGAS